MGREPTRSGRGFTSKAAGRGGESAARAANMTGTRAAGARDMDAVGRRRVRTTIRARGAREVDANRMAPSPPHPAAVDVRPRTTSHNPAAMDSFLLGLSLGLGAGLAPGPLLALVIRTALQDGAAAGVRVAFSPLVTDVPIILVAVLLAASLPEEVLGVLGIAGGAFVVWLGIEALRDEPAPTEAAAGAAVPQRDIARGALTNVLSPHPWVFWLTVGAPILASGTAADAALFLFAFYLLLIGAKVVLA